jgi:ABC-type glycerol-3-phosphate transport system substrate-binding protein
MEDNEEATVRTITAYRELIVSQIQNQNGRVVDAKGDNLLAEFSSVVDAVRCAVEIQRELGRRNAELPEHRKMEFRIGVNLGDVIEEEETIYGDGVNIAARLESLAEGGVICISGTAFDHIGKRLSVGYEYLGEQAVKNIENPVRVYRVLMEPEAVGKVIGEERPKRWRWAVISAVVVLTIVAGALAIWNFYLPKRMTILIRMMEPQEKWFTKNILKKFEDKNHCKIILKRFGKDSELVEILKKEAETGGKGNVSLVKTPLHLTLLLYKAGLVKSFEEILSDMGSEKPEIESIIGTILDDYDPVALEMGKFTTITGEKLYFLPRKVETRLMVYRKSKVTDAVENWHKFQAQIQDVLKRENGYGLPGDYSLESDINRWDFYDVLVAGYYWANVEYNGKIEGRIAHRSKNYAGTVIGLIDRALQLGAVKEDIREVDKSSEPFIDMLHWESIFRNYNLYSQGMWEDDGLYGFDIYKGIEEGDVFLTWLHQLDCMLLYKMDQLGMANNFVKPDDLGVSIMPQGVSFELTTNGRPKRMGTREAHTFGWFWGIPKGSPEPELAFKLAMFITSYEAHLEEAKNFFLVPVRKSVREALKADLKEDWQLELYDKSIEQFKINGNHLVPRFITLAGYQEFLKNYYDAFEKIVIKKGYDQGGEGDKVDRNFIRENINNMSP